MKNKKPEILSPAGSLESLKAAIAAGCDAIYIGGKKFGARAYADNPEEDEMIQAISYCHLHGKKIYMTVNTLLKEEEISELYAYLAPYYEAGLDAVIVQDVGVIKLIHEWFPDISIHASTQMTLTMGESANFLMQYGVDRMVPSRELSLEDLAAIRKETTLELEVFVHGALCYCYSGQCLFSSMLGGRSGNRGRCAQPCRLSYEIAEQGKKEYILSPKELCNLSYIGEMIEMGIDSFKIEGRMKRPEYTAFVTSMYRKYVDLYCSLGKEGYKKYLISHNREWEDDVRKLAELYNRSGFTQGYFEGKAGVPYKDKEESKGSMLSNLRPKHGGVKVGVVTKKDKYKVWYRAEKDISAHDVVEFRDERMMPSYEYTLGDSVKKGSLVETRYQKGSRISVGDGVYRTKDSALLEAIRDQYLNQDTIIEIKGKFIAKEGEKMAFSVSFSQVVVTVEGDICQHADKKPAAEVDVKKVLSQTGNTFYRFSNLEVQLEGEIFLPVGMLKKLRRETIARLEKELLKKSERELCNNDFGSIELNETVLRKEEVKNPSSERAMTSATVQTMEQLKILLKEESIGRIYLKMETMSEEDILNGVVLCHQEGKESFLSMPHIVREGTYSQWEQSDFWTNIKEKMDGCLVRNMESLQFIKKHAICDMDKIILDAEMYVMNNQAQKFWLEQGLSHMTFPYELTKEELNKLSNDMEKSVIVYGHIPLMVSAQCVKYNTKACLHAKVNNPLPSGTYWRGMTLRDQKKRVFRVENYCKYCYNEIFMEEPFQLLSERESLLQMGVTEFRYDFLWETEEEMKCILRGQMPEDSNTAHFYHGIQ